MQNIVYPFFAVRITQDAVMAHLHKSFWQNVLPEPADKFTGQEDHEFYLVVVAVILVLKLHGLVANFKDTMIGYGHFVCVTLKVFDYLRHAAHGRFGIYNPLLFVQFWFDLSPPQLNFIFLLFFYLKNNLKIQFY